MKTYSKSQILKILNSKIKRFKIPELLSFNVGQPLDSKISLDEINDKIRSKLVIIRSSAADEDGQAGSLAGEYASVLNIPSNSLEKITEATNTVIASYEKKRPLLSGDEVIIQEMLQDTTMSGVIFTHDLNTGAPYYVINYDDQSGLTYTVTSGGGEYANRTLYVHRNSIDKLHSERFLKLLQAVQELEQVMESQFLDIEFSLGKDLTPYLLQVRAITTQDNWNRSLVNRINSTLQGVHAFTVEKYKKLENVYGETTILGQMPDWNPIEMIGRAPRALALSLYQTLITSHAWSDAREIMGYMVPTGQPLMVSLAGQPFIDTRLSFHSYLPSGISPIIAEKLVNHWVSQLKDSPELHDKIEFDIAITAFSFDIDDKIDRLIGNVLTDREKKEFKQAHLEQTRSLVKGCGDGSIKKALDKIKILSNSQGSANSLCDISLIFPMMSNCIRYGTTPFSILARHGFIAKTLLLSLFNLNIITKSEVDQIQSSIHTIASDLVDDIHALRLGNMSYGKFMSYYGHLRPGTYDIRSQRYDQMGDVYNTAEVSKQKSEVNRFQFTKKQSDQVNRMLIDIGFEDFKAEDLLSYVREATVAREYGKFVFTRSVSDMLELIANFSKINGLSREEISHVPIESIFNVAKCSNSSNTEERLRNISELNKYEHQVSVAVRMPQILIDPKEVYIVPFQVSHPNFITHKEVVAECVVVRPSEVGDHSLKGKIVVIEGADPGYDWIFSQEIAGLVTKYGGVNSHMAIRCAEFGIPAAIGCGEQRYDLVLKSNRVHLDCAAGLINSLY